MIEWFRKLFSCITTHTSSSHTLGPHKQEGITYQFRYQSFDFSNLTNIRF